ncbi:hypothetical protein ACTG9Q_15045 [Actinokineospora sp. 24-640]
MIKRMLIALPAALLLGCSTDGEPRSAASATPPATTTTTTEPMTEPTATEATATEPTAQPTSEPTTHPSGGAALRAADGRDLRACADGRCEVIVTTGDSLPNKGPSGPMTVTVTGDTVSLSGSSSGFTTSIGGPVGSVQQTNDQVFRITAIQGGKAVLLLSLR